jgi:1-acyl-sn-glycerol-3-phosphate acyltransferase
MIGDRKVRAWRQESHPLWLYKLVQLVGAVPVRFIFRVSARGFEKIPRSGPVILASNHASNLDPLLVTACLGRPLFHLGKHELFRNRLGGLLLETLAGQIAVNRDAGGNDDVIEAGRAVLDRGLALGIYPEGSRTVDGHLQPGRTGVALFAYLTGVPVFPVAIKGAFDVLPESRVIPRFGRPISVVVGDPLQVPRDSAAAQDSRRCRELTDDIMLALAQLLGVTYRRSKLTR